MQVHLSYPHGAPNLDMEKIIAVQLRKLTQLLGRFSPDLIHLHGVAERGSPKQGPICSLQLWLPTARLHAKERARDLPTAVRASFDRIVQQVKKHKEVLRREGEWKRKRYRVRREAKESQAGELHLENRRDLRDYLDQVLPQLKLFIDRELRFRRLSGEPDGSDVQQEEILDEVVARAMEDHKNFSGTPVPFHGLLNVAIHVLNGAFKKTGTSKKKKIGRVAISDSADPADLCLSNLPAKKRQIYVLHALEGFSFEEAAQVLGQLTSEVEETFQEVSREISLTIRASRPAGISPRALG
jgi:DNA-directed RNA polymerase specialized sigma24 family protein/ribosome-associated translation inhibitor RaiA